MIVRRPIPGGELRVSPEECVPGDRSGRAIVRYTDVELNFDPETTNVKLVVR
jgi:hypothetical protein